METKVTDLASMGGDLSYLARRDYENCAARRAPLMAANMLDLLTVRTLSSTSKPKWLDDLALRAQVNGDITHGEALQLQESDLVLEGAHIPASTAPPTEPGPEGESPEPEFYLLAEISTTIQERDVTRAVERAAILQKATGVRTEPLLMGTAVENGLDKGDILFMEVPALD